MAMVIDPDRDGEEARNKRLKVRAVQKAANWPAMPDVVLAAGVLAAEDSRSKPKEKGLYGRKQWRRFG
jgi:hypothetical protein